MKPTQEQGEENPRGPGFLEVMLSVIAAAFGVQSSKNRARDFSRGNPLVFLFAGLLFTCLFVLAIIGAAVFISSS